MLLILTGLFLDFELWTQCWVLHSLLLLYITFYHSVYFIWKLYDHVAIQIELISFCATWTNIYLYHRYFCLSIYFFHVIIGYILLILFLFVAAVVVVAYLLFYSFLLVIPFFLFYFIVSY